MFSTLKKRWLADRNNSGNKPDNNQFQLAMTSYPPINLPHKTPPKQLNTQQVQDNFDYWTQVLPERILLIRQLLSRSDIHWPDPLTGFEYNATVSATRDWAESNWPSLRRDLNKTEWRKHWQQGDRHEEYIGLSLVSDISLLIGQLIIANRPTLSWGMDTDPSNSEDDMPTVNRLILQGKWLPDPTNTICIDVEQSILTTFIEPENSSEQLFNTWATLIGDSVRGEHEGIALINH